MPLLKTINDYLVKEHSPILIDGRSFLAGSLDRWGLIHIEECSFYPGTYKFYRNLLHEFVHLDKLRTTGSANGHGLPMGLENINELVETEIEREVEQMITQNCLAYRFLKEKVKSARFISEYIIQ